ncbi:MBL fold metallo-hydrolase [Priestia megaterium]
MIQVYEKKGVTCVKMDIVLGGKKVNTVYTLLVDGMLIDTGPKRMETELISFYDNHSFDFVILTHSHEDHTGTAPWIQENRKVPIYIHPKGIEICAQAYPYPKYRQLTWGKREGFKALPLGDTIQSRNQEWKVIYTPGHADDHISLFNEETGTLFSGDLFVARKTKVIMNSESIPVIMDSIRTLLSYDFESMFCCHAGYVENGKKMLKQKLDYLENLCGEVKNLHKEGLSIEEIKNKLFPKKYGIISVSEREWDSLYVVSSILTD